MALGHRPTLGLAIALLTAAPAALAVEYPIGAPENRYGMEIGAVYLQAVRMEPDGMMLPPEKSDIHLEADIKAIAGNPNGFAEGAWIPYLFITYELVKDGSGEVIKGELMPMVASDGPHYGDNVKLAGPGRYKMTYVFYPPNASENHAGKHYGRHTDRATGVRPWFPTFKQTYDFVYAGIGKKGGY
jgi:uncharacterized protein involved in high-affinity Fe2+ transport